ncbi:MAG TPA: cytochrome c peroxidase [Gemmatimonadaceae bacterium]|nr:cytochrome c peroxidase [Gemmatimonadaceae bacterium]
MSRKAIAAAALAAACAVGSPKEWGHAPPVPRGLDLHLPVPADNPLTPEKVALGRRLFFEPLLSRDSTLSCASCHQPALGFGDGRARSPGADGGLTQRSAPAIVNRAYGTHQFWDGRADALEEQVLATLIQPRELGGDTTQVLRSLRRNAAYRRAFRGAFGRDADAAALAAALASYVRTILSGDAPFDRYAEGDTTALTPIQRAGLRLFRGKARCATCHLGSRLTDDGFHNTGVAWRGGALRDSGRFTVTRSVRDLGAFKTPTLREISRTAPYMHDGSLATLEEVVEFYDRGGIDNPHLDPELRQLHLRDTEKRALIAFLGALSGAVREGWYAAPPALARTPGHRTR